MEITAWKCKTKILTNEEAFWKPTPSNNPKSHERARMKSSSRHPRPKMQTQATVASAQTKLRKRNPSSC
jgi:hypothetical protein